LIAEILFECWKPFPPENFNGRDAADFAHCLSELVTSEISANKTVNKMFGASVEPL